MADRERADGEALGALLWHLSRWQDHPSSCRTVFYELPLKISSPRSEGRVPTFLLD